MCPMLHAKFQDRRIVSSGQEDFMGYYHIWALPYMGMGPFGHVTKMTFTKLMFPLPKKAPRKVWLRLAKWFKRKRCMKIMVIK